MPSAPEPQQPTEEEIRAKYQCSDEDLNEHEEETEDAREAMRERMAIMRG